VGCGGYFNSYGPPITVKEIISGGAQFRALLYLRTGHRYLPNIGASEWSPAERERHSEITPPGGSKVFRFWHGFSFAVFSRTKWTDFGLLQAGRDAGWSSWIGFFVEKAAEKDPMGCKKRKTGFESISRTRHISMETNNFKALSRM